MIDSIKRIVTGECAAAGSHQEPDFEFYDQFPLTINDPTVTDQMTSAFTAHFDADAVLHAGRQTASEDFSRIPDAFGVPYTFWLLGGVDPETSRVAAQKGTVAQDIPANHSPKCAPVIDATKALVAYSVFPPNTVGTFISNTSRTMPPPMAVTMPSMIAGN